jgi:hypothetical protein
MNTLVKGLRGRALVIGMIVGLILAGGVVSYAGQVFDWLGIGGKPNLNTPEKLRIVGRAVFGAYGQIAGEITLLPPDGTGYYHIDNPGGQRLRISGGNFPGQYEYMTVGHPGRVTIRGDLYVTGRKNFVHDHPTDKTKKIIYVSLEGPEAGTYIRGTAKLVDGEAVIHLPEHFSLVTSTEGITVQLTCLDECKGLRVAQKSDTQITVKELLSGRSSAKFDYLVQGVRRGFEKEPVIESR